MKNHWKVVGFPEEDWLFPSTLLPLDSWLPSRRTRNLPSGVNGSTGVGGNGVTAAMSGCSPSTVVYF